MFHFFLVFVAPFHALLGKAWNSAVFCFLGFSGWLEPQETRKTRFLFFWKKTLEPGRRFFETFVHFFNNRTPFRWCGGEWHTSFCHPPESQPNKGGALKKKFNFWQKKGSSWPILYQKSNKKMRQAFFMSKNWIK